MAQPKYISFVIALSILPLFSSLIISRNLNASNGDVLFEDDIPVEQFDSLKIHDEDILDHVYYDEYETVDNGIRAAACQINIRDLPQRKPLLRNPSTHKILLPDSAGSSVISLRAGSHFEIDCPGSNIVVDSTLTLGDITDAVCVSGTTIRIGNRNVDFASVVCSRRVASVARYTGKICWNQRGRETEVGFQFTDGHFIREMTTCFDPETRNVYYSLFNLSHQIGDQNTGGTRPGWTEGTFYNLGIRLDRIYPIASQRVTINRLVGLPDESTKYVPLTGNFYVARGHLTARSDYIYYAQQEATFHYLNSLPQWQSFNAFNWAYFERNVRQYAARTGLDLVVMTGGYGISTLPHEQTNRPVDLYLFNDDAQAIPIPALFWKVVYSPSNQKGIAVLGINNPYLEDIKSQIICPDIADQLNWLSFDRTILTRGYMFACTIADLRKIIPEIPNYRVNGILN